MHVARSQTNEGVPSPGEPGNVVVRTRRRGRDDAVNASGAGRVYSAVVGLAPSSRRDVGLGLGGKRDVRSPTSLTVGTGTRSTNSSAERTGVRQDRGDNP